MYTLPSSMVSSSLGAGDLGLVGKDGAEMGESKGCGEGWCCGC
jgi:hypothetical protein